jgi:hypothetical protein
LISLLSLLTPVQIVAFLHFVGATAVNLLGSCSDHIFSLPDIGRRCSRACYACRWQLLKGEEACTACPTELLTGAASVGRFAMLLGLVLSLLPPSAPQAAEPVQPRRAVDPMVANPVPAISEADQVAYRVLEENAELRVERMPLTEFSAYLSQRQKIPFQLDLASLRRAKIDPATAVTVNSTAAPLKTSLRAVLKPLGLTYHVAHGTVLIADVNWALTEARGQQAPQLFGPQIAVELAFVKNVSAPTADQLRAIDTALHNYATDVASLLHRPLADQLLKGLTDCVEDNLPKEQVAHYRDELAKRRSEERRACVETFVAILDLKLRPSESQRRTLVAALTSKWQPAWNQIIEIGVGRGDGKLPDVPDELLALFLDSDQAKIWENLPKSHNETVQDISDRIGSVGSPDFDVMPDAPLEARH